MTKIIRIGRFDKDKPKRPMLITFKNSSTKVQLFKNIRFLRSNEELKNISISISNDLTKKDQETALRNEAKRVNDEASGAHPAGPEQGKSSKSLKNNN